MQPAVPPIVFLPLDAWKPAYEAMRSLDLLMEADGRNGRVARVRAAPLGGFLHASTGACFGPVDGAEFTAYPLIPATLYRGETTLLWHDEAAIEAGRRERGDSTGLVVEHGGRRFVFGPSITVRSSMPSGVCSLSVADAKAFIGAAPGRVRGKTLQWCTAAGFPVRLGTTRYPADPCCAELFYRVGNGIASAYVGELACFASSLDRSVLPVSFHPDEVGRGASFASGFPSSDALMPLSDWAGFRAYYADGLPVDPSARRERLRSLVASWERELSLSVRRYDELREGGLQVLSAYELSFYQFKPLQAYQALLGYQARLCQAQLAMLVCLTLDLEAGGAG